MNEEQKLENEITELTNKLREEQPSVYKHVTENPVTLPDKSNDGFVKALKKYKGHLEDLLNK